MVSLNRKVQFASFPGYNKANAYKVSIAVCGIFEANKLLVFCECEHVKVVSFRRRGVVVLIPELVQEVPQVVFEHDRHNTPVILVVSTNSDGLEFGVCVHLKWILQFVAIQGR